MTIFIILAVSGILSMFAGAHNRKSWGLPVVMLGTTTALAAAAMHWVGDFDQYMHNMLIFDGISISFGMVMFFLSILILMASYFYYSLEVPHLTDLYALLMFSLSGAFLLVSANNLVMVFLGAEILSIPLYILAASHRLNLLSNEAGLKYYLMGSFATCFLLLGITLMYGASGTFDIEEIGLFIKNDGQSSSLLLTGFTLLIGALLFKLSAVPFHFWAPDVYEGAPTMLTAFVSTVVKVSVLGIMVRLIQTLFAFDAAGIGLESIKPIFENSVWYWLLYLASAASMIFGSVVALRQTDVKRLLAYTGIHNAGFILIPVLTGTINRIDVVLYYLLAYGMAAIFSLITYTELKKAAGVTSVSGLHGLFYRNRVAATAFIVALLSFAGIPPLAGFWGKIGIFSLGIQASIVPLIMVAVVTSVIGAYNYSKIVVGVMTQTKEPAEEPISLPSTFNAYLTAGSILLLLMGLFPGLIMTFLSI